jgi:hypothetical protein
MTAGAGRYSQSPVPAAPVGAMPATAGAWPPDARREFNVVVPCEGER